MEKNVSGRLPRRIVLKFAFPNVVLVFVVLEIIRGHSFIAILSQSGFITANDDASSSHPFLLATSEGEFPQRRLIRFALLHLRIRGVQIAFGRSVGQRFERSIEGRRRTKP